MKKYNTPEFMISMFDTESVETIVSNTETSFDQQKTDGTLTATTINWEDIEVSF